MLHVVLTVTAKDSPSYAVSAGELIIQPDTDTTTGHTNPTRKGNSVTGAAPASGASSAISVPEKRHGFSALPVAKPTIGLLCRSTTSLQPGSRPLTLPAPASGAAPNASTRKSKFSAGVASRSTGNTPALTTVTERKSSDGYANTAPAVYRPRLS